jgi:hypothetical protein
MSLQAVLTLLLCLDNYLLLLLLEEGAEIFALICGLSFLGICGILHLLTDKCCFLGRNKSHRLQRLVKGETYRDKV